MSSSIATREFIRALPKAELHCHLDGSLRPQTLEDLARERGVKLPVVGSRELASWMRVDDAKNLEDYLSRFAVTLSVMQDAEAIERVAYELVLDAAHDGVQYIETRFCPALSTEQGLSLPDIMEAIIRGTNRGELESGTVARVIVCALRSFSLSHAIEMAELALSFKGSVVAFDLAGGEAGNPAARFADAFAIARNGDLAVTVHAGEAAGAESIREAVHLCGADRIGHGTRLYEDQSLLDYIADRGITLEVCPTSNVQTRVVSKFASHPFTKYLESGIKVTINTDNRLMSGVSLTDEYEHCASEIGMSAESLTKLAVASFESAFLPILERRRLVDAATSHANALLSKFAQGAA